MTFVQLRRHLKTETGKQRQRFDRSAYCTVIWAAIRVTATTSNGLYGANNTLWESFCASTPQSYDPPDRFAFTECQFEATIVMYTLDTYIFTYILYSLLCANLHALSLLSFAVYWSEHLWTATNNQIRITRAPSTSAPFPQTSMTANRS